MGEKRKQLTKGTRFKVFNRDGFTCQYCGQMPPAVVLEVDHILPVALGGTNNQENLITACFDCNRGKAASSLTTPAPIDANTRLSLIKERESQLKALKAAMAGVEKRIVSELEAINAVYMAAFPDFHLTESFLNGSVRGFLEKLPFHSVNEAMRIACARVSTASKAPKYFCGVCWNKIKRGEQ